MFTSLDDISAHGEDKDLLFCDQDLFSSLLCSVHVGLIFNPLFAELGQKKSYGGGNII